MNILARITGLDETQRAAFALAWRALGLADTPARAEIEAAAARVTTAAPLLPLPAARLLAPLQRQLSGGGGPQPLQDRVNAFFAGEATAATPAWNAAVLLLALAAAPKRRLVVYTALVGPKEALADPLAELPPGATSDLELDFVCITDNPALRSPVWRLQLMPGGHLPPEKLSRRPKALPHLYFPEAAFSLYIDNTVTFKRLPQASDLDSAAPYLFKAFRHATRDNPEQEAAAVAMLGYDDVNVICEQMAFYAARRPLAEITPLTTATVLLREHHRPEVQRFGSVWWESILAFSKRDQLSFDFARLHAGCAVEYWPGGTHDNDFIRWHGSLSQRRVKASFDSRRYAWQHRDDADAQRDPKAHFLAHHAGNDAPWLKPAALFELVCQMHGSSLGRHVSPRRAVAALLEPALAAERREGRRYLLLRVQAQSAPQAFGADELEAAARALSAYLSPARGTLIDIDAATLVDDATVYTGGAGFDLLVVLGATAAQLPRLIGKVQRLLKADGRALAVLAAPATLAEAAAAERGFAGPVHSALHAASHDDCREALPNSLLTFEWQAEVQPARA
jgi:hypothetical protein